MRLIVGIALLLLGVGTWSCRVEGLSAEPPRPAAAVDWVRTVDGWERPTAWQPSEVPPPRLHPLVVAFGQGLLSILALAAYASTGPALDHAGRPAATPSGCRRA